MHALSQVGMGISIRGPRGGKREIRRGFGEGEVFQMKSDVTASTHKERKPKKVLSHIEVHEGENGGHTVKHIHTSYEHPPEDHVFGAGQGGEMLAHVGKTMNVEDLGQQEGAPGSEGEQA